MKTFYMLYTEGTNSPTQKYVSLADAEEGAKELLLYKPQLKIYILKCVKMFESTQKIKETVIK